MPSLTDAIQSLVSKTVSPNRKLKKPVKWTLGIGAGVVGVALVGAVGWVAISGQGFNLPGLHLPGPAVTIFNDNQSLSKEAARKTYGDAILAQSEKRYDEAIPLWESLLPAYPGLEDFIRFHLAEIYGEQGKEAKAQEHLKVIHGKGKNSPLFGVATYRLGQSFLRAQMLSEATRAFNALGHLDSKSPYRIGSAYYLGQMAWGGDPKSAGKALPLWRDYLDASPDGRFALNIAQALDGGIKNPNGSDHERIGTAFAKSEVWDKAYKHLALGRSHRVWFDLAKSELMLGKTGPGLSTMMDGLNHCRDYELCEDAVDLVVQFSPSPMDRIQNLKTIASFPYRPGGDYALWHLSQLDSGHTLEYLKAIVDHYPTGDYAPESSWKLLWEHLKAGDYDTFLSKADTHYHKYPHAMSSPRVLFWKGRVLEAKNRTQESVDLYKQVLKNYPETYYAFRSFGRLVHLEKGEADPGWWGIHSPNPKFEAAVFGLTYPPPQDRLTLSIIPDVNVLGRSGHAMAQELQSIGAVDDIALMAQERFEKIPPPIASWQAFQQGKRVDAIRTIRQAVIDKTRKGISPTLNEIKLLYPVVFEEPIAQWSKEYHIPPFLVQGLMREESYFNELAVSSSNALGLMQLLPSTAREVAGWVGRGSFQSFELFKPEVNAQLGTRYLQYLHTTFANTPHTAMVSVGAYNGGPGAMSSWIRQRQDMLENNPDLFVEYIPYDQTRDYIKKVYTSLWNYHRTYAPETIPHYSDYAPPWPSPS